MGAGRHSAENGSEDAGPFQHGREQDGGSSSCVGPDRRGGTWRATGLPTAGGDDREQVREGGIRGVQRVIVSGQPARHGAPPKMLPTSPAGALRNRRESREAGGGARLSGRLGGEALPAWMTVWSASESRPVVAAAAAVSGSTVGPSCPLVCEPSAPFSGAARRVRVVTGDLQRPTGPLQCPVEQP